MRWTTAIHSHCVLWDHIENSLRFVLFWPMKMFFQSNWTILHGVQLRQKDVDNSEGVEYYLFLPFQHLSKYQYFMDRIINALNIDNDTAVMAACSKAMKNVERLIKDMHSSWTTADVHVRRRPMRKLSNLVLNGLQNIRRHWYSERSKRTWNKLSLFSLEQILMNFYIHMVIAVFVLSIKILF